MLDLTKYIKELFKIYGEFDKEYKELASFYNFNCSGCEDNCCNSVFYHYTLIEYFALLEGFNGLSSRLQKQSIQRAKEYIKQLNKFRYKEQQIKIMCPLNYDGLCAVYEYRPLICRVYGLPGVLNHPIKGKQEFKGCKRFQEINKNNQEDKKIDRTPYYTRIATIETRLRKNLNYLLKFKKTIAEMIIDRNF